TRFSRDWSSDVCSSDLDLVVVGGVALPDVEDQVVQGGVAGAQFGGGADGELVDGAVLAAEPSLPRQPAGEEPDEGAVGRRHGRLTPSPRRGPRPAGGGTSRTRARGG